ncbi:magnesium/cobalt transporter CorA [Sungkyunkwania multivorans]|uniref:Magnesium transport protein CorA n=1 Tax=Sungkyunkwania multivorans TaxID=1173618 RepID=A0ABW3CWB0_9FLAO
MSNKKHPKRPKRKKRSSKHLGQAPGAVVYVGEKEFKETKLEVHDYTKTEYNLFHTDEIQKIFEFKGNDRITWINVNGLGHANEIMAIGKHYNLHPLILEDIVNTEQRPKIDEYESYLFVVLKMLYFDANGDFVVEHISIVLGEDYVITFQESEDDLFDTVRLRLKDEKSRLRNVDSDYLAFALMDAIVDNYFVIVDTIGERVEQLEDDLFTENVQETITRDIQTLKHDILRVRRNILPSREVIGRLVKSESNLIYEKTRDYLRDLQDHVVHINENIDVYREMIWGLMDMYMTTISNKMNSIMKVLTIIATIFIPLTFIAGIYGMNFEHMPELQYKYGYYVLWGIMLSIFIALLFYFKKKKWLS